MDLRLLFVGLWSYVDDNGVGLDDYRQITADLFAFEEDQTALRAFVRDGLATLSRGLLVVRYTVEDKSYLFVTNWDRHQKVDRPNQPRYPRPPGSPGPVTSRNGVARDILATSSRHPREIPASVVGKRGKEQDKTKPPVGAAENATQDRAREVQPPQPDLPDPPPGPAATGPRSGDAFRLVNRTIGLEHPTAIRTSLAIETNALLAAGTTPELITAALALWLTKPTLGPRVLPSLVSEVIRTRNRPTKLGTTDQRVADIQALKHASDDTDSQPTFRMILGGAS